MAYQDIPTASVSSRSGTGLVHATPQIVLRDTQSSASSSALVQNVVTVGLDGNAKPLTAQPALSTSIVLKPGNVVRLSTAQTAIPMTVGGVPVMGSPIKFDSASIKLLSGTTLQNLSEQGQPAQRMQYRLIRPITELAVGSSTMSPVRQPHNVQLVASQHLRNIQVNEVQRFQPSVVAQRTVMTHRPAVKVVQPQPPRRAPPQDPIEQLLVYNASAPNSVQPAPNSALGKRLASLVHQSDNPPPSPHQSFFNFNPVRPLSAAARGGRRSCNCTKSMCLKLYCDCFANGDFCRGCRCCNCFNNLAHESERSKAIRSCLDRNPLAFHPKIGNSKGEAEVDRQHTKGCHCKKSSCLKNYCECFEAKVTCGEKCKCVSCKNTDARRHTGRHVPRALGHLATMSPQKERHLPPDSGWSLRFRIGPRKSIADVLTDDLIESTAMVLLAKAQTHESSGANSADCELAVLREFGNCLQGIIHTMRGAAEQQALEIKAERKAPESFMDIDDQDDSDPQQPLSDVEDDDSG